MLADVPEDRRSAACLDDEHVKALAALGKRIEKHRGAPQDIEWAVDDDGAVHVLQVRPETVWSCQAGRVGHRRHGHERHGPRAGEVHDGRCAADVKPAPLDYLRPASLDDALRLLDEHGDLARPLAGGQSLVPMLHMRLLRPMAVIDLNGLEGELGGIDARGAEVVVGALVRYAELERSPVVAEHLPLLQHAVRHVGDRQVRNRGTLGGSLAQSDPTGEMPLVCLALDARIVVRSVRGERTIPAQDFFVGAYENALAPDELITQVRFPPAPGHCAFFERGRRHNDFATVSVVAAGSPGAGGRWYGRPRRARRRQRPPGARARGGRAARGRARGTTRCSPTRPSSRSRTSTRRTTSGPAPATASSWSASTCGASSPTCGRGRRERPDRDRGRRQRRPARVQRVRAPARRRLPAPASSG